MIRRITVLLHFPGDAHPIDVSHLYRDGSGGVSERLFNDDKKSVQDTFSFALIHNQVIVDKIRSSRGKIGCKIFNAQTSAEIFSGVIEPNASQGSHQVNEPIRLEVVDSTDRLDEMVATSFQFPSSLSGTPLKVCDYSDPANSIFHQVCYLAGYAPEDLVSGVPNTATIQHCSAKASQETYRQFLDGILFEHLLVLDDDGQGRLTTKAWTRSDSSYDQTLDSKDLSVVEPVTWQRRYIQEDGIALEWAGTQILEEALLYRESLPVTAQGEFTGQPIAAGDYFPPDSDIQDVYQEYIERWLDIPYLERETRIKNRDISLITTDQASVVFEGDDGVILNNENYDWHRSQIRFRNTTAETKSIYKFEVRGRALIRSVVYTTTSPEEASNPKPYTSRFVFSHATAQALANALALDIEYADFDYSFGLNRYLQPGTVVRLVNLKNNIDTRVIIRSCDYEIGRPVYRYSAVGLAEFSSLSFVESLLSPSMGPLQIPGSPGAPGYRTATMTLYKWLSNPPTSDWPTGFSTYTWATGEWTLPATPCSWTKTPGAPAQGQLLYAINLIVTNNNTDAESTVYWLASPTVIVVGAAGIDGDPGDDGKTTELRFAKNTSATTGPAFTANNDNPGAAWSATEPSLATNEYLWRISSMWLGTERLTNWTGLVRMSGIPGPTGATGAKGAAGKFAINADPWMDDFTQWASSGASMFTILTDPSAPEGNKVLASANGAPAYAEDKNYIAIDRNKSYRVRFWAKADTAGAYVYFCLRQFQNNAGTICPTNGGRSPYKPAPAVLTTSWVLYEFTWSSADWQASMKYVKPDFLLNYNNFAGYVRVTGLFVQEIIRAGYIEAGAITANEIASDTITALQMSALAMFSKAYEMSSDGALYVGNPSYDLAQLFFGRDGGKWKFRLGDWLKADGTTLEINGDLNAVKIKASSAIYSSDGKLKISDMAIGPGDGFCFATYNQTGNPISGSIRQSLHSEGWVSGWNHVGLVTERYDGYAWSGSLGQGAYIRCGVRDDGDRYQALIQTGSIIGYPKGIFSLGTGISAASTQSSQWGVFHEAAKSASISLWASSTEQTISLGAPIINVSGSILPSGSVDVGSGSQKFRDGYFSGNVHVLGGIAAAVIVNDVHAYGSVGAVNVTRTLPALSVGQWCRCYATAKVDGVKYFRLLLPSGGTYKVFFIKSFALLAYSPEGNLTAMLEPPLAGGTEIVRATSYYLSPKFYEYLTVEAMIMRVS